MTEEYERRSNKKLNVTIGLVITLMLQFGGVIWWASTLQAEVKANTDARSIGKRWTYEMAMEEREMNKEEHEHIRHDITALEARTNSVVNDIKSAILRLEIKLDKIIMTR